MEHMEQLRNIVKGAFGGKRHENSQMQKSINRAAEKFVNVLSLY